jgi:DNA-binding NarL/FixJ family response regulator
MNEDPELAAEAFRAGASAHILKQSAASELLSAIREVTNGRSYVTPLVTEDFVAALLRGGDLPASRGLTARQREVLQLLAEGHSMKKRRRRAERDAADRGVSPPDDWRSCGSSRRPN